MKLPFTLEQFLEIFRQYNTEVWPAQIIILLFAFIAVYFLIRKISYSDKIITGILCFFWLWMGVVYHLIYFFKINKAATVFGSLFIIQALLFFYYGFIKKQLSFKFRTDKFGIPGIILLAFALFIYPLFGYWLGHMYPSSPTFGLPCPTTIFTFGMLLFSTKRLSIIILFIPFLWSLIGFSAAFKLGMKEDLSLLFASVVSMIFIAIHNRLLKHKVA